MKTTVILTAAVDLGVGKSDRVTFAEARWHTDDCGTLHILREGNKGNVASFAHGEWRLATNGNQMVAAEVQR